MIETIRQDVKAHLKPSRYRHTLGVCKLAVSLAKHYKVDEKEAEIAALLHDYHKYASHDDILETYIKEGEKIDAVIRSNPNLGHGFMSAVYARDTYQVSGDVFHAIVHHTFGRPGMSLLEKIIYLADSLEEGRDFDGVDKLRASLYEDLDETIINVCQNTLLFEINRGNMVQVQTILMRNELLEAKQWT